MGVQGTQNGGIDGAPLAASMAGGVRELMAENLLAVWLGLECASGNDTRISESEIRVGAKIAPYLMAGSDLICSGFGSIKKYDNSFNASLFNGEEIEDFLVLQRDFEADGGLVPASEDDILGVRVRATEALSAVLEELGLASVTQAMRSSVVFASGSDETASFTAGEATAISDRIKERGITAIDIVKALARRGFEAEAENLLFMLRQRVSGDYLQTSAVIRGARVMSAINTPNDYQGPGTGYRMTPERWREVRDIRGVLSRDRVLAAENAGLPDTSRSFRLQILGPARRGDDPHEVVIGLSPAFAERLHQTTAGHPLGQVVRSLTRGIGEGGGTARLVRILHTADTSFLGLTAAKLSGSGFAIGIQAKGTAVIHRADRLPHLNLELFSNAPLISLGHYRALGRNAARYTYGERPEPVIVPVRGEALGARFHVRVALLYALETELVDPAASPLDVAAVFAEADA
jgi:propanediol dehydratase large subunit